MLILVCILVLCAFNYLIFISNAKFISKNHKFVSALVLKTQESEIMLLNGSNKTKELSIGIKQRKFGSNCCWTIWFHYQTSLVYTNSDWSCIRKWWFGMIRGCRHYWSSKMEKTAYKIVSQLPLQGRLPHQKLLHFKRTYQKEKRKPTWVDNNLCQKLTH